MRGAEGDGDEVDLVVDKNIRRGVGFAMHKDAVKADMSLLVNKTAKYQ